MGFILSADIDRYVEEHTTPPDALLQALDRETHLHFHMPQMLSGHVQGKFLEMIAHMVRPKHILEIGTFTGYSAICLARGLQPGGRLITIDIDPEIAATVRDFVSKSELADRIDFRLGSALDIIPKLYETFDMVFIDADKINYSAYFDLVIPKVRMGGFILADNVLWSGKVLDEERDKETQALADYSDKLQNDPRVENVLLSVRDGIMLARKISD